MKILINLKRTKYLENNYNVFIFYYLHHLILVFEMIFQKSSIKLYKYRENTFIILIYFNKMYLNFLIKIIIIF